MDFAQGTLPPAAEGGKSSRPVFAKKLRQWDAFTRRNKHYEKNELSGYARQYWSSRINDEEQNQQAALCTRVPAL